MSACGHDEMAPASVTAAELRDAIGRFATGVTVVSAIDGTGRGYGTTANAVSSVSLDPPLVLVCLREQSETLAAALASDRFAVNVLRHDQRQLADRFARRAAADTWHGVGHRASPVSGAPVLDDVLTTLECSVYDVADGGDHRIVIGRVLAVEHPGEDVDPLLFYRGAFHVLPTPPAGPARSARVDLPEVALPSAFGALRLVGIEHDAPHHASVVALVGEPRGAVGALAYVHLGCVLGDALGHVGCRRRAALHAALETMRDDGRGLIIYHRDGGSPFGDCCMVDPADRGSRVSGLTVAALRRTVEQLRVHRIRLLVDPRARPARTDRARPRRCVHHRTGHRRAGSPHVTDVLVIVGSATPPGRLRRVAAGAVDRAGDGVRAELLDLAEVRIVPADGRPPDALGDDTERVVATIDGAGAVLLATPVYRGSLTGTLKNLLDHVPVAALQGKPVGIVAMGATDHHFLGAERHLRDILAFFGALVAPVAVYLTSADFVDGEPQARAREALDALVDALVALERSVPRDVAALPAPLAARPAGPQ